MTMPRIHQHVIKRDGDRYLYLFSRAPKQYQQFDGLPAIAGGAAHLRQNPLSGEWVAVSSMRQGRTFLPDQAECPFCVMDGFGPSTDIPVDDYEIAIFTNRFSALIGAPPPPPSLGIPTAPGLGLCEVISYSATHDASRATICVERISLLIEAISTRVAALFAINGIAHVLPFENKGREIGVTIDHPHGQIYALSHIPDMVARNAATFAKSNPLAVAIDKVPDALVISRNACGIAFVPEWARYPFEVWVVPFRRVGRPDELRDDEIDGFAELLDIVAKKLDAVFATPMPLTMGWQVAPLGYEDNFHFHCVFQPLRRSKTKLKYLAAVEQIAGFFLLDLAPERAAAIINGLEQPDD